MTLSFLTLITYRLIFWTLLLVGLTIDTYWNNCFLPWELMFHRQLFLQLVSLIEDIKEDGKD